MIAYLNVCFITVVPEQIFLVWIVPVSFTILYQFLKAAFLSKISITCFIYEKVISVMKFTMPQKIYLLMFKHLVLVG